MNGLSSNYPSKNSQGLVFEFKNSSLNIFGDTSLSFSGCVITMPPSTLPIYFSFLFSGMDSSSTIYDSYLKINAILKPTTSNLAQVDLNLSNNTIGENSTYTFYITISQSLTDNPIIVIDFPS
jgi:hypothetical protein